MKPLLRISNADFSYGHQVLLDHCDLQLVAGVRLGILGRNGEGKSTLLQLIIGSNDLDSGEIWLEPGIRVAQLQQALPAELQQTVFQYVASGLSELGHWLAEYHDLAEQGAEKIEQLSRLQTKIEAADGWKFHQRIEQAIDMLGLAPDLHLSSLSGGWQRKAGLARALVTEPDILLLDEPTNHVDIEGIEWLEKQLLDYRGAVILITHDRAFLQAVATQIAELDRGNLHIHRGDYQSFLAEQAKRREIEERENALFDKRLAEEERWIRQGIKARRTRNEGRVRRLKALREERGQRRNRQGESRFRLEQGGSSGKLVFEAENISHSFDGNVVIKDFSVRIMVGDRIGLIGPNGAGKSTLLNILLGNLSADSGTVKKGSRLQTAYFSQGAQGLDMEVNVCDYVAEGRERFSIADKDVHIISYLADFLFSAEKARTPLKRLSGGEVNRAIFAKLFSQPANLLVLDEPTNDLDIETMELLEEQLLAYKGTVLLVSHDRQFLDNVVTSTLAFRGAGLVEEYVGGFWDYLRQVQPVIVNSAGAVEPEDRVTVADNVSKSKAKLSYKLQRELDTLPQTIAKLESRQAELTEAVSAPDFYQREHDEYLAVTTELSEISVELEQALERWLELDE